MGCNSFITEDGFSSCSGVNNKILDLADMPEDKYDELLVFFENACGLFDATMTDYNKCVNTLSLLYKNFSAYDKNMLHNIQHFLKMHKQCGIWISLILKEDYDNE